MRVVVDVDKCIGAGQCVRAADSIFAQNEEDGLVVLLQEVAPPELHEAARTAARWCPARAIDIVEDDPDSNG